MFHPISVLPLIPICITIKLHLVFSDQIVNICQHTCSLSSLFYLTINQRLLAYTLHCQPPSKWVILHIQGNTSSLLLCLSFLNILDRFMFIFQSYELSHLCQASYFTTAMTLHSCVNIQMPIQYLGTFDGLTSYSHFYSF